MGINKRIGIIRARNDRTATLIPDADCLQVLMTGKPSLFRYWSDTTENFLDFIDSPMFPWIDIQLGADVSRNTVTRQAIAALRAKFPNPEPMKGLDGLIVLVHPGLFDMPNPNAGQPGQPATLQGSVDGGTGYANGLPAACFAVMLSNLCFMSHELGHVLGFQHGFGLQNDDVGLDRPGATFPYAQEYRTPYDIMSALAFGGGHPIHTAGAAPAGWPFSDVFSSGPNLARANLHLLWPEALAHRVIDAPWPTAGGRVVARLAPPSGPAGADLLILRPPGEPASGVGRLYVEYRPGIGWDAGLDPDGNDLARAGVVVHAIVNVPGAGPRIWFKGAVALGAMDQDVEIAGTPLVVQLTAVDPDSMTVEIAVTVGATRMVVFHPSAERMNVITAIGATESAFTICGGRISKGRWAFGTAALFDVTTTGMGGIGRPAQPALRATWSMGGVPLIAPFDTINVIADGVSHSVRYEINDETSRLKLWSQPGERYALPVGVTVSDGSGSVTAADTFTAPGWVDGVYPPDESVVAACIDKFTGQLAQPVVPFLKPLPALSVTLSMRVEQERQWFERATVQAQNLPPSQAAAGTALAQLVALQMQPMPTLLDRLLGAGIDFSVPRADLQDWLNDAVYTPYPALTDTLLRRLNGHALVQPVYIDVIVFNYENTPGVTSPRTNADVRTDILEAAVVAGYNNRYDSTLELFDLVLVP